MGVFLWILGGGFALFSVLVVYCCAVAAGRADEALGLK